ncbi:hypothetical protein MNBD_IGNAVI01-2121 [hydrothermal vent metagenome]|uniref:Lipocalin-like domain-containing protein n=1 Tax=hydrothermal vent metagenome TaxID=652676 RepID=A0A3B1CEE3_9ZZZZ
MSGQKLLNIVIVVFLLAIIFVGCKDDNPTDANYDTALVGSWNVDKIRWEGQSEKGSYDRGQLDSLGTIWTMTLKSDKTVEMTTNYCCALTDYSGSWSATKYELTLKLKASNSSEVKVEVYQFVVENARLIINWQLKSGTLYYGEFIKL